MLHYTSNGLGDTIILIHGFCENSTCFNEQVFLLKTNYNVITVDLPGHGKSPIMDSFTMNNIADEIKDILNEENITKCVIIGHSMGGYVTLAFAKKYSSMLKGFGLLHSTANADSEERKAKRIQAISMIAEKGPEVYVRNFIPPLFAKETPLEIVATRQTSNNTLTSQALSASLTAMKNREDSNAFISDVNLPIAFFIGKHDVLIPANDMLVQAASVKVAQVTYLEHAAHMGMLEEPVRLSNELSHFAEYCFKQAM